MRSVSNFYVARRYRYRRSVSGPSNFRMIAGLLSTEPIASGKRREILHLDGHMNAHGVSVAVLRLRAAGKRQRWEAAVRARVLATRRCLLSLRWCREPGRHILRDGGPP